MQNGKMKRHHISKTVCLLLVILMLMSTATMASASRGSISGKLSASSMQVYIAEASSPSLLEADSKGSHESKGSHNGKHGSTGGISSSHDDSNHNDSDSSDYTDGDDHSDGDNHDDHTVSSSGSDGKTGSGRRGNSNTPVESNLVPLTIILDGLSSEGLEATVTITKFDAAGIEDFTFAVVESKDQVVQIDVPMNSTFKITCEYIQGFNTPDERIVIIDSSDKEVTLEYTINDNKIEDIKLVPESLTLKVGDSHDVSFVTVPAETRRLDLSLTLSCTSDAVEIDGTYITAKEIGEVIITGKVKDVINDGTFSNNMTVEVIGITNIPIMTDTGFKGELYTLPKSVSAEFNDGSTDDVSIEWKDSNGDVVTHYITQTEQVVFEGKVAHYEDTVTLTVNFFEQVIPESFSLSPSKVLLEIDQVVDKEISIMNPVFDSTPNFLWESLDTDVAVVSDIDNESATVKAVAVGKTMIRVTETNSGIVAFSQIEVIDFDGDFLEARIAVTKELSIEPVNEFDSVHEIYLRAFNITEVNHAVKLIKEDNDGLIETIEINPMSLEDTGFDHQRFSLFDLLNGTSLQANANYEIQVEIGDDTLLNSNNFKIRDKFDSSGDQDKIPTGNIEVNVWEIIDGDLKKLTPPVVGTEVLLAREIAAISGANIELSDYQNSILNINDPLFVRYSDEVKMFGYLENDASSSGYVNWVEPKELLKIGGYFLLMDLPKNYVTNLKLINPSSEDGELMNEIHLMSGDTVKRNVVIQNLDNKVDLTNENMTLLVGHSEELSIEENDPNYSHYDIEELSWELSDVNPYDSSTYSADHDDVIISGDPLAFESTHQGTTSVILKGLTPGQALINLKYQGSVIASSIVHVALDPEATDPQYIIGVNSDGEELDEFESKEDVWIKCHNLPSGTYYVRVDGQGNHSSLVNGPKSIYINSDIDKGNNPFNLFDVTDFKETTKNSKSYFVSMSQDPSFPKGDEDDIPKTFYDNFKITSPIPAGELVVRFTVPVEDLPYDWEGTSVILARELSDYSVSDTIYDLYLNPYWTGPESAVPKYIDEVKMQGVMAFGDMEGRLSSPEWHVVWDVPEEVLKIGGYILLMEEPDGYVTNLNEIDPSSEEGELIKQVTLVRDEVSERHIVISVIP